MPFIIKNNYGETEEFDVKKFQRSLTYPGTPSTFIESIIQEAQKNVSYFKTTEDIFRFAFERLKGKEPHIAARYKLKRALLEFGPTGFPFEKYVAHILEAEGYSTQVDTIVKGWCVDHEIDIIAHKDNKNFMVECKFHNTLQEKSRVQVPLYTEARFHDIKKTWKPNDAQNQLTHTWIVTNTEFTYEALKYSNCIGIRLTSWNYPQKHSLSELIVKYKLYPITAIPSLTIEQKQMFIQEGFVLAKEADRHRDVLKKAGFKEEHIKKLLHECKEICGI